MLGAAFSPDGQQIATSGSDKTTRIWNAQTGAELARLGADCEIYTCVYSPAQPILASSDQRGRIRLWDTATWQLKRQLDAHSDSVWALSFSRDGRRLASGSLDFTSAVWDIDTYRPVRLPTGTSWIRAVDFDRDGTRLATGFGNRVVRFSDPVTGKTLGTIDGFASGVSSVRFSQDGQLLAVGTEDGMITIHAAATGQVLRLLRGHTARINGLAFDRLDRKLASSSSDSTVRVWKQLR